MATIGQSVTRDPFARDSRSFDPARPKPLPILPPPNLAGTVEVMDHAPVQSTSMGPPSTTNAQSDRLCDQPQSHASSGGMSQPAGAAAAAQQPKIVQTAFIHKLYNMLEDQSIQHLISWSSSNESFVMSPSSEFSKVLAQYFKHTNISSFVRQLNMYGFHKVSDVFHTSSPDSPLWEFKHGAGNFKRGDLAGLREIKRRASRHALIHRDSFSTASKLATPQPPGSPIETFPDPASNESRLSALEWSNQDLHARLLRSEDAYTAMASKFQTLLDSLHRCHRWSSDLSAHLLTMFPDQNSPIHRDMEAMRQDIARHMDHLKNAEEPREPLFPHRSSLFQPNSITLEPAVPISPRQRPFDESRRPSLQGLPGLPRPTVARGHVPSYLQVSPRRYGSIGTGGGAYSPSRLGYAAPPAPPQQTSSQHPLSNTTSPPSNLPRRHTSADIRLEGWDGDQPPPNGHPGTSPYASGHSSSAWPSSPRTAAHPGDQQIRDALAQYELPRTSRPTGAGSGSRQHSPAAPDAVATTAPVFSDSFGASQSYANTNDSGWQIPGARFPLKGLETPPGPPTRRSSMASNVHSLLNPADTASAARNGEDESAGGSGGLDDRKRKRVI